MRKAVWSVTARDQLAQLLAQGVVKFGPAVVGRMRDRVLDTIDHTLAHFPGIKSRHRDLGLVVYSLRRPPFCILYDYDEQELRVHFIMHAHADLKDLDPERVSW